MSKLLPTKEGFKKFLKSFNTYQRYYLGAVLVLTAPVADSTLKSVVEAEHYTVTAIEEA